MAIIRLMNENDYEGKGYVHYQSWIETYTGLIDQNYLNTRTLDKCIDIAKKYPENTFVSEVDGKIVGFASYGQCHDEDLNNAGEIYAIYVLKAYQNQGIGKMLMDACINALKDYQSIVVWALATNDKAIGFYQHLGFIKDGKTKVADLKITSLNEVRLIRGMR